MDTTTKPLRINLLPSKDGETLTATLEEEPIIIGRSFDAELSIDNPSASRQHAAFSRGDADTCFLEDLNSRSGTMLNWMRLDEHEKVRVRNGDRLRIGTAEFIVRLPEGDGAEDESAPEPLEAPPTVPEDEYKTRGSLLLQLNAGETIVREVSWESFYERYVPLIMGFARRAGARDEEAEDVCQEVMANFFRAASRFEYDPKVGRFRGYLKACTLNAMRSRWRKKKNQVDVDASTGLAVADEAYAEHEWEQEWVRNVIARALETVKRTSNVSEQSWEAFELYGRREVPVEEVAERLGMNPEAIRQAKSRIARQVRTEIERIRIEEG